MIIAGLIVTGCGKEDKKKPVPENTKKNTPAVKSQTLCPIMKSPISTENFADHDGKRIFFCCPGCDETFQKDPAKYIKEMEDAGITLAKTPGSALGDQVRSVVLTASPTLLCGKCGQVKGSDSCCKPDAKKCDSCNLAKGSPACCKGIDFTKGTVELCAKCGQVKGTDKCCDPGAKKCDGCNLAKGSPACCKDIKTVQSLVKDN